MRGRWVRIAVVIVTVATLAFAGHRFRLSELTLDDEQNVERVFTDLSWALTLTLGELRAAQQALVAAGQNRVYWTAQVNSHLETLGSSLDNLGRLATHPTSIEALDSAGVAVSDLERMNSRALEHVNLDQPLLASDLLFTDGLELAARAATHVELARATERTTHTQTIRAARGSQTTMIGTAAGVSVLGLLLLVGTRRDAGPAPFESADAEDGSVPSEGTLSTADRLMLRDLDVDAPNISPPLTSDEAGASDGGDARGTAPAISADSGATGSAPQRPSIDPGAPVPDLRAAADLCTDFARLADTRDLPSLLARATELINASGLILWVRDPSGQALRPATGHGYAPRVLARLGTISKDGNNATAAAYRHARMQVVDHDEITGGALAVPLMSADSCVGVLSVELRDGWESSGPVQATAAIIGAQLATLLAADPPTATTAPPTEAHG
jgi:hypothetical protein